MKKLIPLAIVLAYVGVAFAQLPTNTQDPCSTNAKITVPIAVATAGTSAIITNANNVRSTLNICSLEIKTVGGTATLEYGTGSSCATAAAATPITGAIAAATTVELSGNHTVLNVPPLAASLVSSTNTTGNNLCLLAGSGTSGINGWVTYVNWNPL